MSLDLDEFETVKPKSINLIPIVDMLSTIIFFLLLSTSLDHYTKQTLPPSAVVTSASTETKDPPLALAAHVLPIAEGKFRIAFLWEGKSPGKLVQDFSNPPTFKKDETQKLVVELRPFVTRLRENIKNTENKSIRISLSSGVSYQMLIIMMDALNKEFPDVVLSSPLEADQSAHRSQSI